MNETDRPVSENIDPGFLTDKTFDDFELDPVILANLTDNGFIKCTPIQAQSLPISLAGRDLAGQAQTGTGKTVAFLLTVIQKLMHAKTKPDNPRALILTPTRELADQIYKEAVKISKDTNVTFLQVVGGIDYQKQAQAITKGVDAIVATPGRIIDYYKQKIFKADNIEILVIDEADRLLDLGFAKDIQFLLKKLPPYENRQTLLFSATLDHSVLELTYEYMKLPEFVSITPQEMISQNIKQTLIHISLERKFRLLLGILKHEDWASVMIFANTKSGVLWLAEKLKANGYAAEALTGDLPQKQRFKLMNGFKAGEIKILVATDVASRGIHIDGVSHVINYDLPQDSENYVHRIGRTARAGRTGTSFSLACENYVYHLDPLEEMLGYKIPVDWPDDGYFPEDAAPGLSLRRGRTAKKTKVGVKPAPVKNARGERKTGRPEPVAEKPYVKKGKAAEITKTSDYFPGTFFGFMLPEMANVLKGINYVKAKSVLNIQDDQPVAPAENNTPATSRPQNNSRRSSGAKKSGAPRAATVETPAVTTTETQSPDGNEGETKPSKPARNYRRRSPKKSKPTGAPVAAKDF